MIKSVVLSSRSSDLITITELLTTEESSPGLWYCSVATTNLSPVSSDGRKDRYEEAWIEG